MSYAAHHPLINCQSDRNSPANRGTAIVQAIAHTLRLWRSRMRERRAFPVLDERDLQDMRLSRWDAERELAKPFWRG